jgi:hypothetical protein
MRYRPHSAGSSTVPVRPESVGPSSSKQTLNAFCQGQRPERQWRLSGRNTSNCDEQHLPDYENFAAIAVA